jgi:hypothetical protein
MQANEELQYKLPTYSDPDTDDKVAVQAYSSLVDFSLPKFISFDGK